MPEWLCSVRGYTPKRDPFMITREIADSKETKMDALNKLDTLDRIIVGTKEKIEHIVGWYALAKRKLEQQDFKMPFDEGVIEFTELSMCLYFKKMSESEIRLCLHLDKKGRDRLYALLYDPKTDTYTVDDKLCDHTLAMMFEIVFNGSENSIPMCFKAVMSAMVYHKGDIVPKMVRQPVKHRSQGKSKKKSHNVKRVTKRIYVLTDIETKEGNNSDAEKRAYTKPDTEVHVRGHWRTYKSGKRVWIEPFDKYKGKKKKDRNDYVL